MPGYPEGRPTFLEDCIQNLLAGIEPEIELVVETREAFELVFAEEVGNTSAC